jgi:hypothetical protein
VIGGSGYFNGTTDYLSIASNSAFDFGTGDFTVEAWIYTNTIAAGQGFIFGRQEAGTNAVFQFRRNGAALDLIMRPTSSSAIVTISSTGVLTTNTWIHVVAVRQSGTGTIYINGAANGTGTINTNANPAIARPFTVGVLDASTDGISAYFNGYISNARVVKGTAVYTAAFTPPTAPLTAITNTSLLLNNINAGIFDNAMMNDLVTVGNAQVSTAVTKFGTGSMAFDGTGDWLTFIDTPNVQLGTGNFTIEGWVYLSALGSVRGFFSKGTSTTGISLGVNALNQLVFNYTASSLTATTALVISTWYHVAVVRNGTATGNVKIYLNGTADATSGGAINDNFNQTSIGYVGADRVATSPMNGYIDDLRVTKGLARYTANFTAPTAAFPDN